jgi:hypothetical protein
MKVFLTAQVFSQSVAAGMKYEYNLSYNNITNAQAQRSLDTEKKETMLCYQNVCAASTCLGSLLGDS